MAFTTILMTILMAAVASAGFSSWDDDNSFSSFSNPGISFQYVPALSLPNPPKLPFNIPSLPTPPPLLWPTGQFPNFNNLFPKPPSFPPLPTFQDIASQKPLPGSNFNGVAVVSHSTSTRGEDGQVNKQGGSTVVLNDNGQVTVEKFGDAPPVFITQNKNPFPDIRPPQFKHFKKTFKPFKPFQNDFNFPKMEPITFRPINPDTIRNHVPKSGETYVGTSFSSHVETSDVNGVKKSSGGVRKIFNDNGKVDEENLSFRKNPQ